MNNDLISREAALDLCMKVALVIENGSILVEDVRNFASRKMDALSAVDAVEVVRCKDCIYWGQDICNLFSEEPDCRYSGNYVHTDSEAFCSYGEKEGIDYEVD